MSHPDDVFVDARAFLPPSPWRARMSNLMVLLTAALLLLGGWLFKDWVESQFRFFALAENEITIPYPPAWTLQFSDEAALRVIDPDSVSAYPPREEVFILPKEEGVTALDVWRSRRADRLREFVELDRKNVVLRNGQQAQRIDYAFVVEGQGTDSPLIAVRAADLLFPARYGSQPRYVVVSVSAETDAWDRAWPTFQRVFNWLLGQSN